MMGILSDCCKYQSALRSSSEEEVSKAYRWERDHRNEYVLVSLQLVDSFGALFETLSLYMTVNCFIWGYLHTGQRRCDARSIMRLAHTVHTGQAGRSCFFFFYFHCLLAHVLYAPAVGKGFVRNVKVLQILLCRFFLKSQIYSNIWKTWCYIISRA